MIGVALIDLLTVDIGISTIIRVKNLLKYIGSSSVVFHLPGNIWHLIIIYSRYILILINVGLTDKSHYTMVTWHAITMVTCCVSHVMCNNGHVMCESRDLNYNGYVMYKSRDIQTVTSVYLNGVYTLYCMASVQ